MATESGAKVSDTQAPPEGTMVKDSSRVEVSKSTSRDGQNSESAKDKSSSKNGPRLHSGDKHSGSRSDSGPKPSTGGSRDQKKEQGRSDRDRRGISDRDRKPESGSRSQSDRNRIPGDRNRRPQHSEHDRERKAPDRDWKPQPERDSGRSRDDGRPSDRDRDRRDLHRERLEPPRRRPDESSVLPYRDPPAPRRATAREGPGPDRHSDSRDGRPSSRERRPRDDSSRRRSRSPARRPRSPGRHSRSPARRSRSPARHPRAPAARQRDRADRGVRSSRPHSSGRGRSPRPSRRHGNEGCSDVSSSDLSLEEDQFSTVSSEEFHMIFDDGSQRQPVKRRRLSPVPLSHHGNRDPVIYHRSKYDRSPSPHRHGDRYYSDSSRRRRHDVMDERGPRRSSSYDRDRSHGFRERSLSPRQIVETVDHGRFASPARNPNFYSPPHVPDFRELSPVSRVHSHSEHEKVATEREKLELQLEKERLRRERIELEVMRAEMERARVQQAKESREAMSDAYPERSPVYHRNDRDHGPEPDWRSSPSRRYTKADEHNDRPASREVFYQDQRHSLERARRSEERHPYDKRDGDRRDLSHGKEPSYHDDHERGAASHSRYAISSSPLSPPASSRDPQDFPDQPPPSQPYHDHRPEPWQQGDNEHRLPPRQELTPERDDFYDPSKSPLYAGTPESPPYPARSDSSARYPADVFSEKALTTLDPYGPQPTRSSPYDPAIPTGGPGGMPIFKPPNPAKPPLKGILKNKSASEALSGAESHMAAPGSQASSMGSHLSPTTPTVEGSAVLYNTLFEKLMTQKPLPSGPLEMPNPYGESYSQVIPNQPDPYTRRPEEPFRVTQDPYTHDQGGPDPYTTHDPNQQAYVPAPDFRYQAVQTTRPQYPEHPATETPNPYLTESHPAAPLYDSERDLYHGRRPAEKPDFRYSSHSAKGPEYSGEFPPMRSYGQKAQSKRDDGSRVTGHDNLCKLDMGSPVSDAVSLSPISDDERRYPSHSYSSRRGHAEFSDINSSEDSPEHPSPQKRSGMDSPRHRRLRSPSPRFSTGDYRSRSPGFRRPPPSPGRRRSLSPRRRSISPRRRHPSPPSRRSPDLRRQSSSHRRSPIPRRNRRSVSPKSKKGDSYSQKDPSFAKVSDKSGSSGPKVLQPDEKAESGPIVFYSGMMCPVKNCKSREFFVGKPQFDIHWKDVHMPEKECITCSICDSPPRKTKLRFFAMMELENHFQRWHPLIRLQTLDQVVLEKMIPKSKTKNHDYISPGGRTYQLGPALPAVGMVTPGGLPGIDVSIAPPMPIPGHGWVPMGPMPGPMMGAPGPVRPGMPFQGPNQPYANIAPGLQPVAMNQTSNTPKLASDKKTEAIATKSAGKREAEASAEQPPAKKSTSEGSYNKKGNLLVVCTNNSTAKKKSSFSSWEGACFKKENVCPMKGCDSGVKYSNQAHFLHHWKTSHLNYEYGPCGLCLHSKENIAILSLSSMQFFKNHFKLQHPMSYSNLGLQRPSSFILIKSNVDQFDTSSFVERVMPNNSVSPNISVSLTSTVSQPTVNAKKTDLNVSDKIKAMTSHVVNKEEIKTSPLGNEESKSGKIQHNNEDKKGGDGADKDSVKVQTIKQGPNEAEGEKTKDDEEKTSKEAGPKRSSPKDEVSAEEGIKTTRTTRSSSRLLGKGVQSPLAGENASGKIKCMVGATSAEAEQESSNDTKSENHVAEDEDIKKQSSDSITNFTFQSFSKCPVLDCPVNFRHDAITAADYLFHWQLVHCRTVQRFVCLICEADLSNKPRVDPARKLPFTLVRHMQHCHDHPLATSFDSIPKSAYRVEWVRNPTYIDPGLLWYDKAEQPPGQEVDTAYSVGLYECPYEIERERLCNIEGCTLAKTASFLSDPQRHWVKSHAAERLQYFCLLCGFKDQLMQPRVKFSFLSAMSSHFTEHHDSLKATIANTQEHYDVTFVMADWMPHLSLKSSPQVVLLHKAPPLPEEPGPKDICEAYRADSMCPVSHCRTSRKMSISNFLQHWRLVHEPLLTLRYMCRRCKQQRLSFHCADLWEMRQHIAMVHRVGALAATMWLYEDPENPPPEQVIRVQVVNSAYIPPGPYQPPEEHRLHSIDHLYEVSRLLKVKPDCVCPVEGCSFGLVEDQLMLEKHWVHVHCPFVQSYECSECRMVISNDQTEPYDKNIIQQHYIQTHVHHKMLYQSPTNPPASAVTLCYKLQSNFMNPGSYWVLGLPCNPVAAKDSLAMHPIIFSVSLIKPLEKEEMQKQEVDGGSSRENTGNGSSLKLTIPKTSKLAATALSQGSVQVEFKEGMTCPVGRCGSGQSFPNIQDFELHWYSHHVRPRGFRCLLCTGEEAKTVYAAVTLRIHMRNEHPSLRAITESSAIPSQFIEQQSMPAFNFVDPDHYVYLTSSQQEAMMLEILSNLCLRYNPQGIKPQVFNKLVTSLLYQLPECTPKQPSQHIDLSDTNVRCPASSCVGHTPFSSKRELSRHWDFCHKPFVVRNYCTPCDLWMIGAWVTYKHFAVVRHRTCRFKEHVQVEMIPNRFYTAPDSTDMIPRLQSDEFSKPNLKSVDFPHKEKQDHNKDDNKTKIKFKKGMKCPVQGCNIKTTFRTLTTFDMHLLESHISDPFVCALCGTSLDLGLGLLSQLVKHYKNVHGWVNFPASLREGALGSLFYVMPSEYKRASFVHTFSGKFELDSLPDVSLNPKNLANPKDPAQPCVPRACICVQWVPHMLCPVPSCFAVKPFTKKLHLDRHWRLDHMPTRDMYCCESCGYDDSQRPRAMFTQKSDFDQHKTEAHQEAEVDMKVIQAPSLFYINPGRFKYEVNNLQYFEDVGQPELM